MSGRIQCPECQTMMVADARFCPGCGTPRTWVRDALEREAARTGTPYEALLERARMGVLRLDVPTTPQAPPPNRLLIASLLAVMAIPFAIGLSVAGADWLVVVGLIVVIAVIYATMQGRIDRLEVRLSQLEARAPTTVLRETGQRVMAEMPTPAPRHVEPVPVEPPVVVLETPPLVAATVRQEPPLAPALPVNRWEPVEPPTPSPRRSIGEIEDLLSGRVLAWVGGLAILLGAVFFPHWRSAVAGSGRKAGLGSASPPASSCCWPVAGASSGASGSLDTSLLPSDSA
jgi:hypothetical protein